MRRLRHPGTIRDAPRSNLPVQRVLTSLLAVACVLHPHAATAQTPGEPLDEIVVSGVFAGPGLWQVTHPDHPGHVLWVLGEPPPLPNRMRWHPQKLERVAAQAQEILQQPGFSLKPDEKVGVLRMLTLVPAAMKLRKNPDKATLQEIFPPDVYARWLVQKKLYLGRDSGVEKMRPLLVADKLRNAAFKALQLSTTGAWGAIAETVQKKKIPVTQPNLEFTFKTDNLRGQLKSFARQKLADEECFTQTIALTEALSNKQLETDRARAWATADLAKLGELPPLPDPDPSCDQAIVDALAMTTPVPADLRAQMDELWLRAAANSVTRNETTLALLPMSKLLGAGGYLELLRQRGYQILPPD
jgi:hypothetical protein